MEKNLTFGTALEAAKKGQLICREGWNGKGMFVFMRPADTLSVEMIITKVKSLPSSVKAYFADTFVAGHDIQFTEYLCMKAADGTIVNGWLASQTDMLATDWCILD